MLNAGWAINIDNFEDFLEVTGVTAIRTAYWDIYNCKQDQIKAQKAAESVAKKLADTQNIFT